MEVRDPDDQPPVLEYEPQRPDNRSNTMILVAAVMALGTLVVLSYSGVSSDFITIPTLKKSMLTAGTLCTIVVVSKATTGRHAGCVVMGFFACVVLAMGLLIMWFWN